MRRSILAFAALGSLAVAACSPAEVVVTGQLEQPGATEDEGPETVMLSGMVVELIPFDRDVVFDSLEAAAESPEPEIPPDLLEAQEQIAEAQQEWQQSETRWNALRDTLQTLTAELDRYSPGEGQYQVLYQEWEDLEAQYQRVEGQQQQAFQVYDSLVKANLQRSEEVRIQRENWANEAFTGAEEIFTARMRESGRDMVVDTTSADGVARFTGMEAGEWWVHARYELPTTELYWNMPVTVEGGEVAEIRLTRENAEVRPNL